MEVTKARQRHGLRLTLMIRALQFLFRINVGPSNRSTTIIVVEIAVDVVIVLISAFSIPSSVSIALVLIFERAHTEVPVELPVLLLDLLHEGPVFGFVEFSELP